MFKKRWQQMAAIVGILVLFVLIILSVFHFSSDRGNPEKQDIIESTTVFKNTSRMTETEIRDLLELKRQSLIKFLNTYSSRGYVLSEITDGVSEEHDTEFLGIPQSFIDDLQNYASINFLDEYFSDLEEVIPKDGVDLPEKVYIFPVNFFEFVSTTSALATKNINQEILKLSYATDSKIEASMNIKLCKENSCSRNEEYRLVLVYEDLNWKVEEIY